MESFPIIFGFRTFRYASETKNHNLTRGLSFAFFFLLRIQIEKDSLAHFIVAIRWLQL